MDLGSCLLVTILVIKIQQTSSTLLTPHFLACKVGITYLNFSGLCRARRRGHSISTLMMLELIITDHLHVPLQLCWPLEVAVIIDTINIL